MRSNPTIRAEEAKLIESYVSGQRPRRRVGDAKQWLFVLLAFLFTGSVYVGLFPWAFYMGGNFHPLGYWAGWGRMHSKTAGDYLLYVQISPETRRMETIIPRTFVKGNARLCTPKGERYSLKLSGSMPPHFYLKTVGQPISFSVYNWRDSLLIGQEKRPHFSLSGRWGQGEIVAEDRQTLSRAFFPDGTLRPAKSPVGPAVAEDIQLTLREGTYSQWAAACIAGQH